MTHQQAYKVNKMVNSWLKSSTINKITKKNGHVTIAVHPHSYISLRPIVSNINLRKFFLRNK